ncbi:hypothetical protein AXG93_763s1170 [Marchantia polymorpha subsp. ruderalis]|uniref:Uncharacterized protein n=1 Tax=Marchantia polymorpha subsp. ruderalis TaxID=1480154 RepID=A0A176WRC3_MARPO|nr:hypothetical protein AXG93_763s1170 [Marchantia polymorpha subsp. ruderalis]
MVSLLHSIGFQGRSVENSPAVSRKSGNWINLMSDIVPVHLEIGSRHVLQKQRSLPRRKLRRMKSWKYGRSSSLLFGVPGSVHRDVTCGCGGRSQYLGKRLSARFPSSVSTIRSSKGQWTGRLDRKPHISDGNELVENQRQPGFLRSKSGGLARSSRRRMASLASVDEKESYSRVQCSHAWKSCQRNLMTAAAVAGLSLSLCSSALASSTSNEWSSIPGYTKEDIETQLMYQLHSEIKAQKEWLEGVGQPLSQWSIDDHVKQKLFVGGEGKAVTKLDESGKPVTTRRVASVVVPLFKPSALVSKERTSIGQDISRDRPAVSKSIPDDSSSASGRSTNSTTTHLPSRDAPELVAVASVPVGSIVSAASRTVASMQSAAVATALSSSPVPGVGLMARIMMHLSGGGIAGAMGATLVYPLDTIKTRMQAQRSVCDNHAGMWLNQKDGEKPHYKDEVDCLRQVIAEGGLGALYSGLVPQLIGIAPEKAMKLTVNEILMEMLESQMPGVGVVFLEFIAGGGGGFSQVVFTNPMEAVKVRLQTQAKDSRAKSMWEVVQELGLHGLYNGSMVTMARDIPSTAIFFAVYTFITQMYPEQSFMAGCIAAIPATVIVTPMDVIKTRMQVEATAGEEVYENAWHCFMTILQKEGPGALFKGSGVRVLKTSPQFGITLMLYDMICHRQ